MSYRKPSNALITGIQTTNNIRVPSVASAQTALNRHQEARPDHLKALRPDAPKALRASFDAWLDRKDILLAALEMAKVAEDAKPVEIIHREQPPELKNVSHEDRVAHGRMGGRPRSDNPSPRALKRRAEREAKRGFAA